MSKVTAASRPSELLPAAILGLLGTHGAMSRTELAAGLRVSSATITQVSKGLIARGMVVELGQMASGGGRPARPLALVGSAGTIVGVKVAASHLAVVAAGLDGSVLESTTWPFDATRPDGIDAAGRLLQGFLADAPQPVLGVGVGVPGAVDSPESGVADSPTIGWRAAPVGAAWRARLGVPVLVENDVNALAVAEQVYGVGREYATYLVVTVGRGIGCGIVIDGAVYRGAGGGAGELGHIPVTVSDAEQAGETVRTTADPPGNNGSHPDDRPFAQPACPYGHSGCLESYIGAPGLLRRAREMGLADILDDGPGHPIDELTALRRLAAAAPGDPRVGALFSWAGSLLGTAVAGTVNLLDPEVVVILGEGTEHWPLWETGFETALRARLIGPRRLIPYRVEAWDERRWAVGAAALVIATAFDRQGTTGRQGQLVRSRLSAAAVGPPAEPGPRAGS